ncbi:M56 family metallopeptidase [Psychroserpens mesophilus]|uniref:M56 family metallopeptidase n=1 Tax=Psychroserpens mesophilus TaxID=325473 RepID=UPI003D656B95
MLIYLLKSSACLALFMIFYKLLLEKTSVHTLKRFYLISVLILAFTIPSLTFIEYIEPVIADNIMLGGSSFEIIETQPQKTATDYTSIILWSMYGLGVIVFLMKFCMNLYRIISRIRNNPKYKSATFINVLVKNLITPHTFFCYIFLNKYKFKNSEIPEEVILHEQAHAKQRHSIDIIFIELLQILFWFNPLIYLIKKDIKMNHEFLADEAVLKQGIQPSVYQNTILAFSSKATCHQLTNAINYSSIKKRFTVMKTRTSKTNVWLRSLFILPLISIMLYGFSEKIQVVKETPLQEPLVESLDLYLNDDNKLLKDNEVITLETIENLFQINNKLEVAITYNLRNKSINSEALVLKLRDIGIKKIRICSSKDAVSDSTLEHKQNASKAQIEGYINPQTQNSYRISSKTETQNDKSDVNDPVPPPVPDDTTPEQHKKMHQAVKTNGENINFITTGEIKTGFTKINGQIHYFVSTSNGKKYYNNKGFEVSKEGQTIGSSQVNASDVVPGQYITKVYSDNKLVAEFKDNNPNTQQTVVNIPSPTKPISRLDHIINMAKKDAVFFYEGQSISSDKAIELIKNNDDLNLFTKDISTDKPRVFLTTETSILEDNDGIKRKPLSAKKM